ncbi:MAG: hypothetical protein O9302_08105 [Cyclobacteriaceae bacterium]|jgi:hypothetical protein|nr:hypothetical protein [Cytophagales bacterium]MCZ8328007.1 hypothetical protein [Cyclobacteriaceae bacterium]
MFQEITVVFVFVVALYYLGRLVWKQFTAKQACESGCAKCSAVDFAKIEAELKKKGI